jgi:prepilin-type N-terminal cleavage/methylation domain-containing protein
VTAARFVSSSHARRGFTIVELLVGLVVGSIVLTSVVQMLIVQGRGYAKQREIIDVRETAREATTLLAWDLRQSGVGDSPLAAISPTSVVLRSPRGLGTICAKHALLPRYGLWKSGGNILATIDDSALVYQLGRDKWTALKITAVGTPEGMGVLACAWPGARPPDLVVEFAVAAKTDTSYLKVGAPFRSFRRVEYKEYELNNRWWLGRKVGAATSYEQLTGPLAPPASNGLTFAYYDSLGAVTTNPATVASVGFTLRTESYKKTHVANTSGYQRDSLTMKVGLRR